MLYEVITPGRKRVPHPGHPSRLSGGQVQGFGLVTREVEQLELTVLVMLDQLPVAVADGAGGAAALVCAMGGAY